MKANPGMNIEDAKVDTKLSILKPLHAKTLTNSYNFFKTEAGKKIIMSGWRGAGILKAVNDSRQTNVESLLDPFAKLVV